MMQSHKIVRKTGTLGVSSLACLLNNGGALRLIVHPAAGVAWLANKLHAVGTKLRRGEIILAGSFTRPVDIAKGDVIQADYGPLGAIGVSFI